MDRLGLWIHSPYNATIVPSLVGVFFSSSTTSARSDSSLSTFCPLRRWTISNKSDNKTHSESHMQCWGVGEAVEVPAALAHSITN